MSKPAIKTPHGGARGTPGNRRAARAKEQDLSASQLIDARIKELDDWRGETLARVRALIKEADPEAVEEWKWRGVPVWSHGGILCTGETYKEVVKLTFAKGAALDDRLGCSTRASKVRRGARSTFMRATGSTKRR